MSVFSRRVLREISFFQAAIRPLLRSQAVASRGNRFKDWTIVLSLLLKNFWNNLSNRDFCFLFCYQSASLLQQCLFLRQVINWLFFNYTLIYWFFSIMHWFIDYFSGQTSLWKNCDSMQDSLLCAYCWKNWNWWGILLGLEIFFPNFLPNF